MPTGQALLDAPSLWLSCASICKILTPLTWLILAEAPPTRPRVAKYGNATYLGYILVTHRRLFRYQDFEDGHTV